MKKYIYQTTKTDPYYQQFNGHEVTIFYTGLQWDDEKKEDTATYVVRHLKTGMKFNATQNELTEIKP